MIGICSAKIGNQEILAVTNALKPEEINKAGDLTVRIRKTITEWATQCLLINPALE